MEKIDELNNASFETASFNNKTDFGLSIVLGKTIKINEKNLIFMEVRENFGLTNTRKNKVWGNGWQEQIH